MKAWEDWAYIVGEDVLRIGVHKIGGHTMAQRVARELYGDTAYAVECTQTPLSDYAKYRDGDFYNRDEEGNYSLALRLPTAEETAAENSNAIDEILISLLEA